MEGPCSSGATAAVREVGLEGPTKHVAVVSPVWNQPQVRLQMEATLRRGWSARVVGSLLSSWPLASANEREMVEANSADAPAPSELGRSQTASSLGWGIQRATRSGGAYDWEVSQKDETQSARSSTFSPWAPDEPWEVDCGCSKQPGMDRGFQRMVPNARRASGGTVDGAGLAQPVFAEYPIVARSTLGAGAGNLPAVVWTVRLSKGHPGGQRQSVWIDWCGGAFAFERLVDGIGNQCGVHRSRPSRTERWARANASSDEGGNYSAALAQSTCAATPDGSVGRGLQPSSPSRRTRAADSCGSLPSSIARPQEGDLEISLGMGRAPGQEQRADQVARPKALRGGSLRRLPGGPEAGQEEMGDLLRPPPGWRTVGTGCGWNATGQVCTWPMRSTLPSQMEGGEHKNFPRERTRDHRFQMPDARCPISRSSIDGRAVVSPHALRAVPLRSTARRALLCRRGERKKVLPMSWPKVLPMSWPAAHPGPLPRERENRPPPLGHTRVGVCLMSIGKTPIRRLLFPLLEGEGQGEGERLDPTRKVQHMPRTSQGCAPSPTRNRVTTGKWSLGYWPFSDNVTTSVASTATWPRARIQSMRLPRSSGSLKPLNEL